ncbi:MAG: hypothetical protein KGZ75_07195 [Syntrophomonadaceae bacterium]|nr:hypothetical protein [Syntrophomonadaceae bacterium]
MIDSLFFDNDCLSSFLWVKKEDMLVNLYPGRIIIPMPVYDELSYPGISHLRARIDAMISGGQVTLASISIDTCTFELYRELTEAPMGGCVVIGKGEAASIALAKTCSGIVASNNLRDIAPYIGRFALKHLSTGDILTEALKKGYITEMQGNSLWCSMLAKRRKLGAKSFTEFLSKTPR